MAAKVFYVWIEIVKVLNVVKVHIKHVSEKSENKKILI